MDLYAFFLKVNKNNIKLTVVDGKLKVDAPKGAFTEDMVCFVKNNKESVIDYLKEAPLKVGGSKESDLSSSQERLWSLIQLYGDTPRYYLPIANRIKGKVNLSFIEESLRVLQSRHEMLRCIFKEAGSSVKFKILENAEVDFAIESLAKINCGNESTTIESWVDNKFNENFDFNYPLWRVRLLKVSDDEFIFFVVAHHLIFDGFSKNIFVEELSAIYESLLNKTKDKLPVVLQYKNYISWYKGWILSDKYKEQKLFWQNKFSENNASCLDTLYLPSDVAYHGEMSEKGVRYPFFISEELLERIKKTAQELRCSVFIVLLSGLNLLLYRYTGQANQLIFCPFSGREKQDFQSIIGYFNNILPLISFIDEAVPINAFIDSVKNSAFDVFENSQYPFQEILATRSLRSLRLSRCLFSLRPEEKPLQLSGVIAENFSIDSQATDFDLSFYLQQSDIVEGFVHYKEELFSQSTIAKLISDYLFTLEEIVNNPHKKIKELPDWSVSNFTIEQFLKSHDKVEDVVILDSDNCKEAWIISQQDNIPTLDELRIYLSGYFPEYLIPRYFYPLVVFPRSSTGEIDVEKLKLQKRVLKKDIKKPESKLEKNIAELWRSILWIDGDIDITENFYNLGGNSLLAVEMFNKLEKILEKKLPVSLLVRANTVEQLAKTILQSKDNDVEGVVENTPLSKNIYRELLLHTSSWEGEKKTSASLITGLNLTGNKPPLFWCFQGNHEFQQMAKYLGEDQPLYGMRSGHLVMDKTDANISDLAEHYANEILSLNYTGPYFIGGNCQAARIAFRIAEFLLAKEKSIALLCLQEQFVPRVYGGKIAVYYGDNSDCNEMLYHANPDADWKKFYTGDFSLTKIKGEYGEFFVEPTIKFLAEAIKKDIDNALEWGSNWNASKQDSTQYNSRGILITLPEKLSVKSGKNLQVSVTIKNNTETDLMIDGESFFACNIFIEKYCGKVRFWKKLQKRRFEHKHISSTVGSLVFPKIKKGKSATVKVEVLMPPITGNYYIELGFLHLPNASYFQNKERFKGIRVVVK